MAGSRISRAALAEEGPPKGEIVLLVGPPGEAPPADPEEIDRRILKALDTLSVKDAASVVSGETGHPRRQVYARAVELAASRPK